MPDPLFVAVSLDVEEEGLFGGQYACRCPSIRNTAFLYRLRSLTERGVRPTLMSPIWRAAAFALGAGTALMGDKAATE